MAKLVHISICVTDKQHKDWEGGAARNIGIRGSRRFLSCCPEVTLAETEPRRRCSATPWLLALVLFECLSQVSWMCTAWSWDPPLGTWVILVLKFIWGSSGWKVLGAGEVLTSTGCQ